VGESVFVPTAPAEPTQLPAVDAALRAAAALLGMEAVFLGHASADTFRYTRVVGGWPGFESGLTLSRADTFCSRMLAGAPQATADAGSDPDYAGVASRTRLGIRSYAAAPVRAPDGEVLGTIGGVDRGSVRVESGALGLLQALADGVGGASAAAEAGGVVLRRGPTGWVVETAQGERRQAEDLTVAMALADLLAEEASPPARPRRPERELDEVDRLKLSVVQLEHALASRVVVEQAIGVLAQRYGVRPREAFERLRRTARGKGRRVHDLAREVVASVTEPATPLPPELRGPPAPRPGRPPVPRPTPTRH
jgi:hypothetical protein